MAQEKLLEPNPRKTIKKPYILTGKLKCDCCRDMSSQGVVGWRANPIKNKRYYACAAKHKSKDKENNKYNHHCPTLSIPSDEIESLVIDHIKRIIIDPKAIDEYIQSQTFFKSRRNQIERNIEESIKIIDRLEKGKNNLIKMREDGFEDYENNKNKIIEKERLQDIEKEKINKYGEILGQEESAGSYKKALSVLKESFGTNISAILANEDQARELIGYLVKEIIIYSRPRKDTDKIPGVRKESQYVPYRIRIILNLPQEFIDSMMAMRDDDDEIDDNYDEKNTSTGDVIKENEGDVSKSNLVGINKFIS